MSEYDNRMGQLSPLLENDIAQVVEKDSGRYYLRVQSESCQSNGKYN